MLHLAMLVLTLAVHAQQPEPAAEKTVKHESAENKARTVRGGANKGVKACHADIERFCKGVKPGEGRLGACLNGSVKKLSKRCRTWAEHGGKDKVGEALLQDLDGRSPAPEPVK